MAVRWFSGNAGQRFLDFLRQFALQQLLRSAATLLLSSILLARLVLVFGVRFLERIGRMARAAADFVQAKVARNGEQPGGKLGARFVACARDL